jgi:hypothetical protein
VVICKVVIVKSDELGGNDFLIRWSD